MTIDDIARHFKRKATELDDLEMPSSPTPQELIVTERLNSVSPEPELINRSQATTHDNINAHSGDINSNHNTTNALVTQINGAGFEHDHNHLHICLPKGLLVGSTERSLFNLRDLVEADFGNISMRNNYPDWWTHLDNIVIDFDEAQFHHMAGRQALAVKSYDRVLEAVTQYAQLPSMALLQLVSYLLSWAAIPVSGDVVRILFGFLDGLRGAKQTHPALSAILPCLLAGPEHASCSIALFQDCISKFLTQQLGQNSITVLRMNLRLCRHVFQMDDQEPAWRTLREIQILRNSCRSETQFVVDPELDDELCMTLHLFDESIRDKSNLEKHMRPCTDIIMPKYSGEDDGKGHSLCNFKLGLYAIAHKQAKATVSCFRKVFSPDDPRIHSAKLLLSRIEKIKSEIKNAGFIWPLDSDTFSNPDSYCDSPADLTDNFVPKYLNRASSFGVYSTTSFDSPQAIYDDYNETLYPTMTNRSDHVSFTSHARHDSMTSSYNSPAVFTSRFQEIG